MTPRIAVLHHAYSFFPLELAQSVGDAAELVWVLDAEELADRTTVRLLGRMGGVVEIAGLDLDAAAARVAAERVDGIVSFVDQKLVVAAELAARLGLRFHSPEQARVLVDKGRQRLALAGVPGPHFWRVAADAGPAEVDAALAGMTFPAVLKPSSGSGSLGMRRVEDATALRTALEAARSARSVAVDGAVGADHVVEAYLPDRPDQPGWFAGYLSVETVVQDGRPDHVALTGRFPLAEAFRETGNFIPALVPPDEVPGLLAMAGDAVEALGIRDAVVHTEIKRTPDGPRLIEVNGRLGGRPPLVLRGVSGVNLFAVTCEVAAGIRRAPTGLVACDGVGFLLMVQPPTWAHRVAAVDGVDEVTALPDVEGVVRHVGAGHVVDWRLGTLSKVLTVRGRSVDHDALRRTVDGVHAALRIAYDRDDGADRADLADHPPPTAD